MNSRRWLFVILGCALVLDVIVANSMSQTMDEGDHLEYGAKILNGRPERSGPFMDIKTPITALNALPRTIGANFDAATHPRLRKFFTSRTMFRLPSILAALGCVVFAYRIAIELYGPAAAIASAALAAFSPNLIAHGTLATTDGYFALGVLSALYFFYRYLARPTFPNTWISAAVAALAQITKPLAVLLYPVIAVFLIAAAVRRHSTKFSWNNLLQYAAATIISAVAVLNVAYLFDRTFTPLGAYAFDSSLFRSVQTSLVLSRVPVPLPYPVLQGLDMACHNDEIGATYGNVYLLGSLRSPGDPSFRGFKSYYLVAWLLKEPIALQVLLIWGLVETRRRRAAEPFVFASGLLVAFSGVLVLFLSFFSKAQIGIRHMLPALAIEVIIAGAVFSRWVSFQRRKKIVLALLMVWLAASMFSYYPQMIPYMNEVVLDRRLAYRFLADSNLDWGQNLGKVEVFLKKNPDVVLDPDQPVAGRILVSANRLVGIAPKEKGPMLWALRYRPIGHVGYAHLLFEIPRVGPPDVNH